MTSAAFVGVVVVTVAATLPRRPGGSGGIPTPTGTQYRPAGHGDHVRGLPGLHRGWALATNNAQVPYDVNFHSEGLLGCGVMVVSDQITEGREPGQRAVQRRHPGRRSSGRPLWQGLLDAQHPNVAMLMAGRWEVSNQVIDGRVMHIGDPAYDAILRADLDAGGRDRFVHRCLCDAPHHPVLGLGRAARRPTVAGGLVGDASTTTASSDRGGRGPSERRRGRTTSGPRSVPVGSSSPPSTVCGSAWATGSTSPTRPVPTGRSFPRPDGWRGSSSPRPSGWAGCRWRDHRCDEPGRPYVRQAVAPLGARRGVVRGRTITFGFVPALDGCGPSPCSESCSTTGVPRS